MKDMIFNCILGGLIGTVVGLFGGYLFWCWDKTTEYRMINHEYVMALCRSQMFTVAALRKAYAYGLREQQERLTEQYNLYDKMYDLVYEFNKNYMDNKSYWNSFWKVFFGRGSWKKIVPEDFHELYELQVNCYYKTHELVVWDEPKIYAHMAIVGLGKYKEGL